MIEYVALPSGSQRVYLDGRHVGTIRNEKHGFAYYPVGARTPGETLPTINMVKATLEEM